MSLDELIDRAVRRQLPVSSWAQIIHLATNHETRFYRNPAVIGLIGELASAFQTPRILSVGCSTGEEPYSIAVELLDRGIKDFKVHGTDISEPCITCARGGVYRTNDMIPSKYAERGANDTMVFKALLANQQVTFEAHNVLSDRPINFARPNIIVTQHMLIYYRSKARHQILGKLADLLCEGGYMITASAEEAQWSQEGFQRINHLPATVFRNTQCNN